MNHSFTLLWFLCAQVYFFLVFLHHVLGAKHVIPHCSHKPSSNASLVQTGGLAITANVIPTEEFLIAHFAADLEQPGGMANLPYIYVHGNTFRLFYRFGRISLRLQDERLYWRASNISRYDALLFNWAVQNRDNGVDINFEAYSLFIPGTPPGGGGCVRQSPGSGCSSDDPSTQLDSPPADAPSFIPAVRGERCAVPGYTLRVGTFGYGHYRAVAPAARPAPSLPPAVMVAPAAPPAPSWPPAATVAPAARPAPSLPPGWVIPSLVGATGCVTDADAIQSSIRFTHIDTGMSGMMPAPVMQVPGSLAAQAATQMATGRMSLPGEGRARAEISPEAAQAAMSQQGQNSSFAAEIMATISVTVGPSSPILDNILDVAGQPSLAVQIDQFIAQQVAHIASLAGVTPEASPQEVLSGLTDAVETAAQSETDALRVDAENSLTQDPADQSGLDDFDAEGEAALAEQLEVDREASHALSGRGFGNGLAPEPPAQHIQLIHGHLHANGTVTHSFLHNTVVQAVLHHQLGGMGLPPTVMGHAHIGQVLQGIQAYLHSHNASHLWHQFLEIIQIVTPPQAQGLLTAHDNLLPSYIGADTQTHWMGLWGLEAHLATWLHHVNVATNGSPVPEPEQGILVTAESTFVRLVQLGVCGSDPNATLNALQALLHHGMLGPELREAMEEQISPSELDGLMESLGYHCTLRIGCLFDHRMWSSCLNTLRAFVRQHERELCTDATWLSFVEPRWTAGGRGGVHNVRVFGPACVEIGRRLSEQHPFSHLNPIAEGNWSAIRQQGFRSITMTHDADELQRAMDALRRQVVHRPMAELTLLAHSQRERSTALVQAAHQALPLPQPHFARAGSFAGAGRGGYGGHASPGGRAPFAGVPQAIRGLGPPPSRGRGGGRGVRPFNRPRPLGSVSRPNGTNIAPRRDEGFDRGDPMRSSRD